MPNKLTNAATYFWHRILRVPIKMRCGLERKVKKPQLTIVCLHGIAADSATWRTTFNFLAKHKCCRNIRFVSLDLLGFGKSLKADWLDYKYDDYLNAISRALKSYHIKTPIILIGHSMGALIAAKFAKEYPTKIRQLILVSPPLLLPEEVAKVPDKFYYQTYGALHKYTNEPVIQAMANFIQKITSFRKEFLDSTGFKRSMKHIILNSRNYSTFAHLKVPTTIIHGRLDPLVYGPNLKQVAKENSEHIKMVSVTSAHDISAQKRAKILSVIEKVVEDEAT